MKRIFRSVKKFYTSLGIVEQSQVVASTSVIVAMVTIISIRFILGRSFEWIDFISVVTVGIFGFITVFFTLKYGRQLEEQRRELLALNMIAEAVNHSVELDYVLRSALVKVVELTNADFGWIYLRDQDRLFLKHKYGTETHFFKEDFSIKDQTYSWVQFGRFFSKTAPEIIQCKSESLETLGIESIASLPLEQKGTFAGVLVIGSKESDNFEMKKLTLLQAFCNQINVALNNASLFEQLKQSERKYADLYEHSPDMYQSIDANGVIVSCNQTEAEMLGLTKDKIIGRSFYDFLPVQQHKEFQDNLRKIFEEGVELKGIENQILRHDNTLIDVSINTSIVYDESKKPALARMVLRDITEKKKMEEKIIQAQKIDSLGSLAGGIAHSFNNILTSVLGAASIMHRKMKEDKRFLKFVDLIENASRRGATLTRQLLTFARKSNPNFKPVNINDLIDETIKMFEATTPKTISIMCNLPPEPLYVNADENQMQQAILNICLNARDAMPLGGTLSIECKTVFFDEKTSSTFPHGKPGPYVMISIADTGTGIPKNIIERIFEPFFTTKEEGKGSGLGLSVTYGVIRSHDGIITVDSEENVGTVFSIFIPQIFDSVPQKVKHKKVSEPVGGSEWILLVEDEETVGEVGVEILKDLGYSVEVARNGVEAIQILNRSPYPFDLVIMDMNMPRIGGRETLEYIRKQFPELKIIVCSGYSQSMFDDQKFFDYADEFIQKPYEFEHFASKIRSVLDAPARK